MLKFFICVSPDLPILHVLNNWHSIFHQICLPEWFELTMKYVNLLRVCLDTYKWEFCRQPCGGFASAPGSLDRWTKESDAQRAV